MKEPQAIVDEVHRRLDEQNAAAVSTGHPWRQRTFPDAFTPDYWEARLALGTITQKNYDEIAEMRNRTPDEWKDGDE